VLKNVLKWHTFTHASVHSSTPSRVSEGKTPIKIFKLRSIKGKGKSPWRVLISSPIILKKKLKARHRKNNLKKMVHNPYSSNSDKNNDTDCCK
jgi:hypothetical protein